MYSSPYICDFNGYPTGPARALLKIVETDPQRAVQELHS